MEMVIGAIEQTDLPRLLLVFVSNLLDDGILQRWWVFAEAS
jgi:hypothetical protein